MRETIHFSTISLEGISIVRYNDTSSIKVFSTAPITNPKRYPVPILHSIRTLGTLYLVHFVGTSYLHVLIQCVCSVHPRPQTNYHTDHICIHEAHQVQGEPELDIR